MKSQSDNILSYNVTTLETTNDTTNVDIGLGIHWQMTHVEYASDVNHLHKVE